ncbi:HEXXH motif domain-containing protein [Sphingomonadaceae bacterium LXI357]|uniref:HEXXH motif domain-containing protein n=1 Tax=Stakelama marina TaxID=2826939 RepID=A0A8T4INL7_9SPHN|nr:HEXXH motif domain-containing protein [Stakelama marina]
MRAAIDTTLTQLTAGDAGGTVTHLVRAIHVIEAPGPGYDISHSEPSIPFSIFVSVPVGERHGTLRLAESLLHEALHLQLTLLERHVPMVLDTAATGYSPWQQSQRPLSGLLHGLYVFAAIDQWLALLDAAPSTSSEDRIYLTRRRAEIAEEIADVATLADAPSLTPTGHHLASWLLTSQERTGAPSHQAAR